MEEKLIQQALENGIWVTLFVVLFLYTMYDGRNREIRYQAREDKYQIAISQNQEVIKELSKQFCIVNEIQKDVIDIKYSLNRGK